MRFRLHQALNVASQDLNLHLQNMKSGVAQRSVFSRHDQMKFKLVWSTTFGSLSDGNGDSVCFASVTFAVNIDSAFFLLWKNFLRRTLLDLEPMLLLIFYTIMPASILQWPSTVLTSLQESSDEDAPQSLHFDMTGGSMPPDESFYDDWPHPPSC